MNNTHIKASRSLSALLILTVLAMVYALDALADDPALPQGNLPSSQRNNSTLPPAGVSPNASQTTSPNATAPGNINPPDTVNSGNNSLDTSTGINVGPGTLIRPKSGTFNGTLNGNGSGVGPDTIPPLR